MPSRASVHEGSGCREREYRSFQVPKKGHCLRKREISHVVTAEVIRIIRAERKRPVILESRRGAHGVGSLVQVGIHLEAGVPLSQIVNSSNVAPAAIKSATLNVGDTGVAGVLIV